MPTKPVEGVVPGDWVRLLGASKPHRQVEGMGTGAVLVTIHFTDGGSPVSVPRGAQIDFQVGDASATTTSA